jgi:hypothetical protein
MKIKYFLILVISFLLTQVLFAQNENQDSSNCDCTECHQLDFWIGEWNVEWENQDSTISEGTNLVNSILDGCVIEENFDGNPGMDFRGKSLSVYNHNKKIWQQTWVDDTGGYMIFTGSMEDDKMILSRTVETTKGALMQRMVFYNIQKDSFDWNWESSTDGGKNWKLNWKIKYTRK